MSIPPTPISISSGIVWCSASNTLAILSANMSATNTITAQLQYLVGSKDGSELYSTINADPKTGRREQNLSYEPHSAQVEDVRGHETSFTLDTHGFAFGKQTTKHTAFTNDEDIKKEYYAESEELLKKVTGATRIHIFDHSKPFLHHSPVMGSNQGYSSSQAQSRRGRQQPQGAPASVRGAC